MERKILQLTKVNMLRLVKILQATCYATFVMYVTLVTGLGLSVAKPKESSFNFYAAFQRN